MPLNDFLQVDDIGIALVVTVTAQDGTTPINLSAATNLTIYILRPDQKLIVGGATFFTDGTDGVNPVYYSIYRFNCSGRL